MLYGFVIFIHVVASIILIAVILLQAGRGGGLNEQFGGSSTQTLFGTKTSIFLTRATAAAAIIYIMTCLTLAVMTSHRGRSLMAKEGLIKPVAPQAQGGVPLQIPDNAMDY